MEFLPAEIQGNSKPYLAERESALARIDAELEKLSGASEALRDELQAEMLGIGGMLIAAREEALRYAELEPMLARLSEIDEEGKAKRKTRSDSRCWS